MAKFFVGQRVKVNCPDSDAHGEETVILALEVYVPADDEFPGYFGIEVEIRMHPEDVSEPDDYWCIFEPHELIPINDGYEKVEWSKCGWSPHGVEA
jgi:hypothetical protein